MSNAELAWSVLVHDVFGGVGSAWWRWGGAQLPPRTGTPFFVPVVLKQSLRASGTYAVREWEREGAVVKRAGDGRVETGARPCLGEVTSTS